MFIAEEGAGAGEEEETRRETRDEGSMDNPRAAEIKRRRRAQRTPLPTPAPNPLTHARASKQIYKTEGSCLVVPAAAAHVLF